MKAAAEALKGSSYKEDGKNTSDDRAEWYDFERCMRLLQSYYRTIYILVDRVDETSFTTRNADNSFKLISPLVTNLSLLNPNDSIWSFKFFLWDAVQGLYADYARTDRIESHKLDWSSDQLVMMLDRRINYYSDKKLKGFSDLFENDVLLNMPLTLKRS